MTPANLPVGIELPSGFLFDPALIDALRAETEPVEKLKRLKQLRLEAEKGRAWVKEQADNLDQIYTEIAQSDANAEHVMAQIVPEKRHAAAERLMPGIEELRQKLAVRGLRGRIPSPRETSALALWRWCSSSRSTDIIWRSMTPGRGRTGSSRWSSIGRAKKISSARFALSWSLSNDAHKALACAASRR
jgi:hypothetical protein